MMPKASSLSPEAKIQVDPMRANLRKDVFLREHCRIGFQPVFLAEFSVSRSDFHNGMGLTRFEPSETGWKPILQYSRSFARNLSCIRAAKSVPIAESLRRPTVQLP
jgi:hypothetical protein